MNNILKKNFVVLLLLISIYVLFIVYNKKPKTYGNNINEGFTPGFREMYRPRVRSARLIVEGYYSKAKNNFRLILKKFGIV